MAKRKITDEQLRSEIMAGVSVPDIVAKYGVTKQSLYPRLKSLALTTVDTLTNGPDEAKRFVNTTLNVLAQLDRGLTRVNKLMDAYDLWLTDPENPDRYEIGPRSTEVMVTYTVWFDDLPVRQKGTLESLLKLLEAGTGFEVQRTETKIVDPRDGLIKTVAEGRKTMEAGVQLAKSLADARTMAVFRDTLLDEIRKVAPDVASKVAQAVSRATVLHGAIAGISGLPSE